MCVNCLLQLATAASAKRWEFLSLALTIDCDDDLIVDKIIPSPEPAHSLSARMNDMLDLAHDG